MASRAIGIFTFASTCTRVAPKVLNDAGFRFQYPEMEGAVRIDGDIPILGPDFIAQAHRIDRQSFTHPVLLLGG